MRRVSVGRGDERQRRRGRRGETNLVVGGMKADTVCVWLIRLADLMSCLWARCVCVCLNMRCAQMWQKCTNRSTLAFLCSAMLPLVFALLMAVWLYRCILCRIHYTMYFNHDGKRDCMSTLITEFPLVSHRPFFLIFASYFSHAPQSPSPALWLLSCSWYSCRIFVPPLWMKGCLLPSHSASCCTT